MPDDSSRHSASYIYNTLLIAWRYRLVGDCMYPHINLEVMIIPFNISHTQLPGLRKNSRLGLRFHRQSIMGTNEEPTTNFICYWLTLRIILEYDATPAFCKSTIK